MQESIAIPYTIGHLILDLEAELGATDAHKKTLDCIIEEARAKITVKDSYTREDAIGILETIEDILQQKGFGKKSKDKPASFHEGLESKMIDCDNKSFIYLSIAETLNLPVVAVEAPNHLFVRWLFDGNHLNWETTSAEEKTDRYYITYGHISPKSISNGIYISSLTREQTIGIVYTNRGFAWYNRGDFDKALEYQNKAISLNQKNANAHNNRGAVWSKKGDLDKAVEDFGTAISLDPNHTASYYNRGLALLQIGVGLPNMKENDRVIGYLNNAISDLNNAIRLAPTYADTYEARRLAYEARRLAYEARGLAYEARGHILDSKADRIRAIIDHMRYRIPILQRIPIFR